MCGARRRQMGLTAPGDRHLHAFGDECARDRETDAARSPGDDRDAGREEIP